MANFLATDEGDLRVLDFEAAGVLGDKPLPVRTFFLESFDSEDLRVSDQVHFFASVLFPYESGRYSWEDRHVDIRQLVNNAPDSEVATWVREKLPAAAVGW